MKPNVRYGPAALCAVALFCFSHGANALPVNVAIINDDAGTVPGAIAPPAPVTFSGTVLTGITGSVDSAYRSPFGDTSSPYSSVEGPPFYSASSGTYSLGTGNAFRIFWGSVDSYNTIEFFNGATLIGSIVGSDLSVAQPGAGHDLVTLLVGGTFDTVVISSSIAAFEFSNVQVACGEGFTECGQGTATPLPAALPLFATGIAGLGAVFGWRKRRKSTGQAVAA